MVELASETPAKTPPRRFLRRTGKVLIGLLVLVVLALAGWRPALLGLGRFLIVDEGPVASDVVVVAGGSVERIPYGVELVKRGFAPRLLVLANHQDCPKFWGFKCDEIIRRRLVEMGLREDQVITEVRPRSTYTDAVYAREDMERDGLASAVVISEPFHMMRLSLAWRRVFAGSEVRLTFAAIPFERTGMSLEGWWARERELVYIFEEYVKLGLYWMKGYL